MIANSTRRDAVRSAAIAYRRLASPLGLRTLNRQLREGLPPAFAAPIRYLFSGQLTPDERAVAARVAKIRGAVAEQQTSATGFSKVSGPTGRYSGRVIAEVASIPADWGMCLFLLAKASGAKTILELGSCAGISGCYLVSAGCDRFVTVEGSTDLAALAAEQLRGITTKATVINEMFDVALARLPEMPPIDLVFIDGDHTHDGRHENFARVQPHLSPGAIVVFDDVHYSEDMWQTWHELRQLPGVTWAVNFGRIGACVWDPARRTPPRYLDLSPLTAWTRIGARWKRPSEMWGRGV